MTWKIVTLLALLATFGFTAATSLLGAGSSSTVSDDKKTVPKTVKIGGIAFYVDYDEALKVAKQKKLPVWLHFGENPG